MINIKRLIPVRIIIVLFIYLSTSSASGQNRIAGVVIDNDSIPLAGVSVCQVGAKNCTVTDIHGNFQLSVDYRFGKSLKFSFVGYQDVVINATDTITDDLTVKMPLYELTYPDYPFNIPYKIDPRLKGWGFVGSLQLDMIEKDFMQYSSLFGDDNIDLMNKQDVLTNWELSVSYQRYRAGVIYGWSYSSNYEHDSLDIEFNNGMYGLSLGYKIVDSRRLVFVPNLAIKWYRFRLINSDKDRRIALNQYMTERDLDVRLNQTVGFIGASLSYKFYRFNYIIQSDCWSVGLYGGYIFKLNEHPWIYSKRNRLIDNNQILTGNLNVGLSLSFIID